MEEMRNVYRILVGKPEGKKPLGRPRRRWEDRLDLREIGWEGVDREYLTSCATISFSRRTLPYVRVVRNKIKPQILRLFVSKYFVNYDI
jgi:hypothetical protein